MQSSTRFSPLIQAASPSLARGSLVAARPGRTIRLAWALLRRLWLYLRRRPPLRRVALVVIKAALATSLLTPLVTYAGSTTPAGIEFRTNTFTTGRQVFPSVAMDANGDFIITWASFGQDDTDLGGYAQRYNAAGDSLGNEFRVTPLTTKGQGSPSVAMDADGDFVVTWQSYDQDTNSDEVYAQRYNAAGSPVGGEFRVNTYTTNPQGSPSVAMDADGDFVIAWNSFGQDDSSFGVYAQHYNAAGIPLGNEFRVNTFTTGHQFAPSVAMDADGDFIITWASFGQDGSDLGVYAQRYNADGDPLGNEFRGNTFTSNAQGSPSVAMDADGDFVIAWQSYKQDSNFDEVYAQHYNAAGSPVGGEFRVNTFITNGQRLPSVALNAAGDFIIAWESLGQDGSSYGVYARYYSATGTPFGREFRVNTFTTGDQRLPNVDVDADGDFVVAWQSWEQDSSDYGIYAQRYTFVPRHNVYLPLIIK